MIEEVSIRVSDMKAIDESLMREDQITLERECQTLVDKLRLPRENKKIMYAFLGYLILNERFK